MTTEAPPRIVVSPRCENCNKKLAEYLALPFKVVCSRCRHENEKVLYSP